MWPWPSNTIQDHCTFQDQSNLVGELWAGLDWGEKRYALDKDFSCSSAMVITFNLKTWLESLHAIYSKALFMWIMSHIWLNREYTCICYEKKRFCVVLYDLNLWTPFKVSTLFDNSQSENEKWARLGQLEKICFC